MTTVEVLRNSCLTRFSEQKKKKVTQKMSSAAYLLVAAVGLALDLLLEIGCETITAQHTRIHTTKELYEHKTCIKLIITLGSSFLIPSGSGGSSGASSPSFGRMLSQSIFSHSFFSASSCVRACVGGCANGVIIYTYTYIKRNKTLESNNKRSRQKMTFKTDKTKGR